MKTLNQVLKQEISTESVNSIRVENRGTMKNVLSRVFKKVAFISTFLLAATQLGFVSVAVAGGSEGGTNIDKKSGELVDFVRNGNTVKIDPREFEGVRAKLDSKIKAIEEKIPGFGKELDAVFDQRSWFITDKEFKPRNAKELKPINQDETYVLINAALFKKMTPERRQRAWLHEMVRRVVSENHSLSMIVLNGQTFESLSQTQIDQMVEDLTFALYTNSDQPDSRLTSIINKIVDRTTGLMEHNGVNYIPRTEVQRRIAYYKIKELYSTVCLPSPSFERLAKNQPLLKAINDLVSTAHTTEIFSIAPSVVNSEFAYINPPANGQSLQNINNFYFHSFWKSNKLGPMSASDVCKVLTQDDITLIMGNNYCSPELGKSAVKSLNEALSALKKLGSDSCSDAKVSNALVKHPKSSGDDQDTKVTPAASPKAVRAN